MIGDDFEVRTHSGSCDTYARRKCGGTPSCEGLTIDRPGRARRGAWEIVAHRAHALCHEMYDIRDSGITFLDTGRDAMNAGDRRRHNQPNDKNHDARLDNRGASGSLQIHTIALSAIT